jgi:crotonobetainyl-CoA:carnitine CoA-transferase CaiB-like acyl-CoA transferase
MGLDRRPATVSAAIRCNTENEPGQKRRGCRAVRSTTSPRRSPLRRTAARNMLISVDDPVTGPLKLAGNPMKLSSFADPPIRQPAPDLDADRDRILRELGL